MTSSQEFSTLLAKIRRSESDLTAAETRLTDTRQARDRFDEQLVAEFGTSSIPELEEQLAQLESAQSSRLSKIDAALATLS